MTENENIDEDSMLSICEQWPSWTNFITYTTVLFLCRPLSSSCLVFRIILFSKLFGAECVDDDHWTGIMRSVGPSLAVGTAIDGIRV